MKVAGSGTLGAAAGAGGSSGAGRVEPVRPGSPSIMEPRGMPAPVIAAARSWALRSRSFQSEVGNATRLMFTRCRAEMLSLVMFPACGPQPRENEGTRFVENPTAPMEEGPLATIRLAGFWRKKASRSSWSMACTLMVWPRPPKCSSCLATLQPCSQPSTTCTDRSGQRISMESGWSRPTPSWKASSTVVDWGTWKPAWSATRHGSRPTMSAFICPPRLQ